MISREGRRAVMVAGGGLLVVAMALWTVGRGDSDAPQEKLAERANLYGSDLWKGMWRNAGVAGPGHFNWPHVASKNAPTAHVEHAQDQSTHHQDRARQHDAPRSIKEAARSRIAKLAQTSHLPAVSIVQPVGAGGQQQSNQIEQEQEREHEHEEVKEQVSKNPSDSAESQAAPKSPQEGQYGWRPGMDTIRWPDQQVEEEVVPPQEVQQEQPSSVSVQTQPPSSPTTPSSPSEIPLMRSTATDVINAVPMEPDVEAAAISGNWTRRAAAGAFCKQDPTGSPEQMPRQCAVWEQPAWGRMKKLPVGNSPQVANGCIEYTCRSVRAEHVIFLDQRLELMLKRLLLACEHGASMIGSWANETWIRMKLNWARMFGLQHTYEQAANEHLAWMQEEAFRKSVMVKMKGDTSSFGEYTHVDPMTITPGTRMESAVSGCMYPFMNCKNQLLQAKRLCHDDGYWVRHVRDFHCTGGFIASEPGEAEKWKYIDHFAISMALLVGAVVIGLVVRAYMLNRLAKHAGVDHRLWWLRGQTEQSTPPDREIVQITV